MQTHHRPELRDSILGLIARLLPAVRDGGSVPLTALVEAVVGSKLTAVVRERLDVRRDATFVREAAGARFTNEGPEARIELKRFDIKLPRRLSGKGEVLGEDEVALSFDRRETLAATKLLLSVRLERIELSPRRVLVRMETRAFDQCLELT
jgi:hypothetical protein